MAEEPRGGLGWRWVPIGAFLLVVAGVAMPSMQMGGIPPKEIPRASANSMISQLKVAVQAFHTEYGLWPPTDAEGRIDNAILYHVLVGDAQGVSLGNPQQIVFMEFAPKDLDDAAHPTTFVDPWWKQTRKNPAQNYIVQVVNDEVRVSDPGPPDGRVPNGDPAKFLRSW